MRMPIYDDEMSSHALWIACDWYWVLLVLCPRLCTVFLSSVVHTCGILPLVPFASTCTCTMHQCHGINIWIYQACTVALGSCKCTNDFLRLSLAVLFTLNLSASRWSLAAFSFLKRVNTHLIAAFLLDWKAIPNLSWTSDSLFHLALLKIAIDRALRSWQEARPAVLYKTTSQRRHVNDIRCEAETWILKRGANRGWECLRIGRAAREINKYRFARGRKGFSFRRPK